MKRVLLVLAALAATADPPAQARPAHESPWTAGLGPATEHPRAQGVQVIRAPLTGRVRIAGASFVMGATAADIQRAVGLCHQEVLRARCDELRLYFQAEAPAHEVTLSPYEIDRTEVTVAEYSRCVGLGDCAPPGFTPGDPRFDRPELPVTYVRWEDANTYCAWSGGRLPTEAEWELAARGTAGRVYPWGDLYNPHLSNHGALADDATDSTDGFVGLAPVGSFPDGATPLGIVDMAGNAAEWVADLFDIVDENGFGYPAASQLNPKGPSTGAYHVVRGGSYHSGAAWIRTTARGERGSPVDPPTMRSPVVGFRCARDAT